MCMIIVARDIEDRRERHRLEVENARLTTARAKDEQEGSPGTRRMRA